MSTLAKLAVLYPDGLPAISERVHLPLLSMLQLTDMKIMKSYRQLIPVVATPILVIAGIILYFSSAALQIFKIHWLVLLAAVILACGPWGKRRLSADASELPHYSLKSWLMQIIGLQLCFGAVFLGISVVCGQTAPVLTPPQPALFQLSLTHLLVTEGLFPWAFTALIAAGMGFYSYCRRQDAYLATPLSVWMKSPAHPVVINFIARFVTFFAYSSTFCFISLLFASVATAIPIVTGFSLTPILVAAAILIFSHTKIYRRNLTKLLGEKLPLIPGLFMGVVFFAVAVWFLNGLLALFTHTPLATPSLLKHWLSTPWMQLWLIFANSWWLLWTPILAIAVARMSPGYRIRELILAVLGLPLIVSLALKFTPHFNWNIPPITAAVIAGAGFLGLLLLTLPKKGVPSFILAYLPREGHHKFRSYRTVFIKVMQTAALFLFIYLPGGMTIIHFLVFAAGLPLIIIHLISTASLFKT